MFIRTRLPEGARVNLIVRKNTLARLKGTYFRGKSLIAAGNFCRFEGPEDIFNLKAIRDAFLPYVADAVRILDQRQASRNDAFSCTLECDQVVGWESTVPQEQIPSDATEAFQLNRCAQALRVKPSRSDLKAPRTRLLTLVYQLQWGREHRAWTVILHSMYPGKDIGRLDGDVTAREGRVFFGWDHPGEG